MSADLVATFRGAARVPGKDVTYTDVLTVEYSAEDETVTLRAGDATITLDAPAAKDVAEFILRNGEIW